jgi:hypothetical protein
MQKEMQEKYIKILRKHFIEGLAILEKMNVKDKNYQQVVVNINNANNIAFQLEMDIENQKKAELAHAQTDAAEILETAKKQQRAVKSK